VPENLQKRLSVSAAGSEQELLNLFRSRKADAMRLFYERYAGFLTAVCTRYITDADSAKDVLQESLISIFGAIDKFSYRGEGSLKAWASRIVVNTALKSLRQHGKLSFVDDVPAVCEDEETPQLQRLPAKVLHGFIRELPDGYRTVFNLFVFEKKSHKEIASLLGVKEDSSASQYFRARALLGKRIKEYLKEHE
jgi:RNA polymerase sigma-70 factor (ECF subfamily)